LRLRLGQSVRPSRFVARDELGDLEFYVSTWTCKEKGKCRAENAVESIQGATQTITSKFLEDILTANSSAK
jgi:hypothetical protein